MRSSCRGCCRSCSFPQWLSSFQRCLRRARPREERHERLNKLGYDEEGYLALPPCLWGDDEGLAPSVLLPPGAQVYSVKKNKNTHTGHYGEMASWQMRGRNY